MVNVDRDENESNIYVYIGEYGQRRSFQLGVNNGRKEASRSARQAQFPFREWAFCLLFSARTLLIHFSKPLPRVLALPDFLFLSK
jgi:hypothetical protein